LSTSPSIVIESFVKPAEGSALLALLSPFDALDAGALLAADVLLPFELLPQATRASKQLEPSASASRTRFDLAGSPIVPPRRG
jgi:hypothetical protein